MSYIPTEFADNLNAGMLVWVSDDLTEYNNALGEMFREVELLSDWEAVFDVDRCPPVALPYLGQFVGARLIIGSSVESQREQIRRPSRQDRGKLQTIIDAVKPLLTGTKAVVVRERSGLGGTDNAWRLTVITLTNETPNPAAVEAAIRSVKPGGIVLAYSHTLGQDWQSVKTRHVTWAAVKAGKHTWSVVKTTPPV